MSSETSREGLNSSLTNWSKDDLEKEVVNLRSIVKNHVKCLEIRDQKIHELKRQICVSKAMEQEFMSEIEFIQSSENTECEKLSKIILTLQEEIRNLKQSIADKIEYYEAELGKNEEILSATNERAQCQENCDKNIGKDLEKLITENCNLKLHVAELKSDIFESETKQKNAVEDILRLEAKNSEISAELAEISECFRCKNQELEEKDEFSTNLQDEILVLQKEIDSYKNVPLKKEEKGNSLFAEVNDKRLKLEKLLEQMGKKYRQLKIKYYNNSSQLEKALVEYGALLKQLENNRDSEENFTELVETDRKHFKNLNDTIKNLEGELKLQQQHYFKIMSGNMKCAHELVTFTRKEVLDLQNKLCEESLALSFSEHAHYNTRNHLKRAKAEISHLRYELMNLQRICDELKLMKSPPFEAQKLIELPKKETASNFRNPNGEMQIGSCPKINSDANTNLSEKNVSRLKEFHSCVSKTETKTLKNFLSEDKPLKTEVVKEEQKKCEQFKGPEVNHLCNRQKSTNFAQLCWDYEENFALLEESRQLTSNSALQKEILTAKVALENPEFLAPKNLDGTKEKTPKKTTDFTEKEDKENRPKPVEETKKTESQKWKEELLQRRKVSFHPNVQEPGTQRPKRKIIIGQATFIPSIIKK